MSYRIRLDASVDRKLEKLPLNDKQAIVRRIARLAEDPYFQARKVRGSREGGFRVRQGDFRIVYKVVDQEVIVYDLDPRDKIYKRK